MLTLIYWGDSNAEISFQFLIQLIKGSASVKFRKINLVIILLLVFGHSALFLSHRISSSLQNFQTVNIWVFFMYVWAKRFLYISIGGLFSLLYKKTLSEKASIVCILFSTLYLSTQIVLDILWGMDAYKVYWLLQYPQLLVLPGFMLFIGLFRVLKQRDIL